MPEIDFVSAIHKKTKRDYLGRVNEFPKAEAAKIARQFGKDYWDGDRKFGYGGMRYDGRWRVVAEAMANITDSNPATGFWTWAAGKVFCSTIFTQVVPGVEIRGLDISSYAIEKAKEEVRPFLTLGHANQLPFPDSSFENGHLYQYAAQSVCYDLDKALRELQRVGKKHRYLCVEMYRTEEEKVNLLYWQLTCRAFYTPEEWEWIFCRAGFTGDYSFISFE